MLVLGKGAWVGWATLLGVACVGCSSPCEDVAELLRRCCAKGPAELRQSCEAEAKRLQDDGNASACQASLDDGQFAECAR